MLSPFAYQTASFNLRNALIHAVRFHVKPQNGICRLSVEFIDASVKLASLCKRTKKGGACKLLSKRKSVNLESFARDIYDKAMFSVAIVHRKVVQLLSVYCYVALV